MSDAAPRGLLWRTWPYLSGLLVCTFFGWAERANWAASMERPWSNSLGDWLITRSLAPVQYALVDPRGWWAVVGLGAMILGYALRPRWWLAFPVYLGMALWVIWGSSALGLLG